MPPYDEPKEWCPKVIRKPTLADPVTDVDIQKRQANDRHPQGYQKVKWIHIEIVDLRRLKEAISLHGIHSPYMKKILKVRATQNKIVPQDWKCITTIIFEADFQLK